MQGQFLQLERSIRMNQEIKHDAQVWYEFLCDFNGECYLPNQLWISNDALELLTDSVGSIALGCGAFYAGHWVQYKGPTNWEHESFIRDIAFLELIPIVLAMFVWAPMFVSKKMLSRQSSLSCYCQHKNF